MVAMAGVFPSGAVQGCQTMPSRSVRQRFLKSSSERFMNFFPSRSDVLQVWNTHTTWVNLTP